MRVVNNAALGRLGLGWLVGAVVAGFVSLFLWLVVFVVAMVKLGHDSGAGVLACAAMAMAMAGATAALVLKVGDARQRELEASRVKGGEVSPAETDPEALVATQAAAAEAEAPQSAGSYRQAPGGERPAAAGEGEGEGDGARGELAALRAELLSRAEAKGKLRPEALFVVSIVLYVASSGGSRSVGELAVVMGVLLAHEAGHLLGLKLFGYRDLKVFFLPFFGAVATGQKPLAPSWQQAVVALLGPLPGVVVGGAMLAFGAEGTAREIARTMIVINALNLLPFAPLDGGRFLQVVLFSRSRWVEGLFVLVSGLVVGGWAWSERQWLLVAVAGFMLGSLGRRFAEAGAAMKLRARFPRLPARAAEASDEALSALLSEARRVAPSASAVSREAAAVEAIHARAALAPPSIAGSLGLLASYAFGLGASLVALALAFS